MSTGDNPTTQADKPKENQAPSNENAWSKVAQDVSAPGSNIDKTNSDLSAFNSSHKLPSCEITGVQANNDQLPGTGHHSDAVQMTENGKQINATYNPDSHILSYQRENSKGPESVSIDMLTGQETTVIATKSGSKSDGTTEGDLTVVRNHAGGDVTQFEQNINGKTISLLGQDGKPLPGLSTDGNELHNHPMDVQIDASGKVKSYNTEAGVKVTLGDDGKPNAYNSNGFTMSRHDDGNWYYHQDSGGDFVKIGEPTVAANGTIHSKESGGWHDGREHELTSDGERTGKEAADRSNDPANCILNDHPKTIEEVLDVMNKLEKALPDDDGLKYFTKMYIGMTQGVKDGLDGKDPSMKFEDPKYMEKFDVNFANLFLDAVRNNLQGKSVPEAWQAVFDARHKDGVEPIQDAMAGMMAHIDHDLPYAIVQTNKDFGITPGKDSPQYRDFEKINDLIAKQMPEAKKVLEQGGLGQLVAHGGALGDLVANDGIKTMRNLAWDNAQSLQAGGTEASLTGTALNQVSGELATQILNPGSIPVPGLGDIKNPITEKLVQGADILFGELYS